MSDHHRIGTLTEQQARWTLDHLDGWSRRGDRLYHHSSPRAYYLVKGS